MKLFFNIFGLKIPAYGFFAALGILVVLVYLKRQRIYKTLDFDTALSGLLYALVAGGIGAKVLYWITDPSSLAILFDKGYPFMERLQMTFSGGMVFLGGLIGGLVGTLLFLYQYKLETLRTLDIFAVGLPILQMFGRMGCFFAGCCYGQRTNSCIGVVFPEGSLAPSGVPLIPTQLFGVAGNLLLVAYLLFYTRKTRESGKVMGWYLVLYSIGRFILEFFRGDEIRGLYGSLSTSQWISIPLLAMGLFLLFWKGKRELYLKRG
ncbi:MAG: prolipoprotein diacylglyceryl transferase [Tissierellia bacterium]|nr:prolipoprotein diacylglyceryl transferase [Tissierellia bacterium]